MGKLDGLATIVRRVCFFLGFGLMVLVVTEELVRFTFGASLLARVYNPENLLGVSVSFFIVAIALLWWQIRDELKSGSPATR